MSRIRWGSRGVVTLLAAVAALASMATHMIVPALPLMATEMNATVQATQSVVSIYLIGLGSGQLIAGPIADRLGRRPVLLGGIGFYTAGAAIIVAAPSAEIVLAGRLLQALGAAAGLVTARAMVSDLFGSNEGGRRQALLIRMVLIAPAIAPIIGGFVADIAGWRAIFTLLAVSGTVILLLSIRQLPETLQDTAGRLDPTKLLPAYLRLLKNPTFTRTSYTVAGTSSSLYLFLGNVPFVLEDYGMGPRETGLCLMAIAAAAIIGTLLVGWLERRTNAIRVGLALGAGGCVAMLAMTFLPHSDTPIFLVPLVLLGLGSGIASPAGIAAVAHAEQGLAGTATSLTGALQMLGAVLSVTLFGMMAQPTPTLLGVALVAISFSALLACPPCGKNTSKPR